MPRSSDDCFFDRRSCRLGALQASTLNITFSNVHEKLLQGLQEFLVDVFNMPEYSSEHSETIRTRSLH
jgi:hypothetical protein